MRYEFWLGLRYLFAKRRERFISIIAALSIGALCAQAAEWESVQTATFGGYGVSEKELSKALEELKDPDPDVRIYRLAMLSNFHCREATCSQKPHDYAPDVLPLLGDPVPRVRAYALDALVQMGAREYLPDIVARLSDAEPGVRVHAIDALQRFGAVEHAASIAPLLKDDGVSLWEGEHVLVVKAAAIRALGMLQARQYADDIAPLLGNRVDVVRQMAVFVLAEMGDREHASDIAVHLRDSNSLVRREAILALRKLEAREFSKEVAAALQDDAIAYQALAALSDWNAIEHAADVLLLLKPQTAMPGIKKGTSLREAAVLTLGKFGAEPYTGEIRKLVTDNDQGVREAAKKVLKELKKHR